MSSAKQKVTVVIPAFNEEKTIKSIIEGVKPFCDEILVVIAKKSNDRTEEIVSSMGVNYIRDQGFGKGAGMSLAISKINKENQRFSGSKSKILNSGVIVFIDADGSHICKDIPKLVRPLLKSKADMVIASRFLGGSEELHGNFDKFLRMLASMIIAQIINWRFKTEIMDTQNGFRAIKADVAEKLSLTSKHTEIETEMCMKCYKKGFRILEIPSTEKKREFGESNISLTKHGFRYIWVVFKNLF